MFRAPDREGEGENDQTEIKIEKNTRVQNLSFQDTVVYNGSGHGNYHIFCGEMETYFVTATCSSLECLEV